MSCAPLQPVGGTFARPVVAAGVLGDSRRFCRTAFVSSARVSRGRDIGDPTPPHRSPRAALHAMRKGRY